MATMRRSGAPEKEEAGKGLQEEPASRAMDRRSVLKLLGVAGATAAGFGHASAAPSESADEPVGILIDTTRCGGCRTCEFVCAEANGLPEPSLEDDVFSKKRETSPGQWTVVNSYETDSGEVFAKKQCMHCVQAACAAACLTKAMLKTEEGPVIWRESRCMGCRFCMISCPFDVPKFEYDSANPKIQKCRLCWEKVKEGATPACAENCPGEALMFGRRSDLIAEARRRIHESPDQYNGEIYGEHEVGGTSALYLASVPFEQLGFRTDLGTSSYPRLTEDFLYGVPIVLTVLPALLLGVSQATKPEPERSKEAAPASTRLVVQREPSHGMGT